MGFDKNLTAGGVYNLLKIARDILPAIEDLQIVESWSGLRPTTRDEAPIIGPSKKIKGLIYATGHHRNGILLAILFMDFEVKGAKRWIRIYTFTLQPSEIIKHFFIILSAWGISQSINGKKYSCLSETLLKVLNEINIVKKRTIAIAVNEEVVEKNNWKNFKIKTGDIIEIVHPLKGG